MVRVMRRPPENIARIVRLARSTSLALVGAMIALSVSGVACKTPMSRIQTMHDALVKDDAEAIKAAVDGLPTCPESAPVALAPDQGSPRENGCLSDMANALGSRTGYHPAPADQAAATTAALVLLRDGRGDTLARADNWLTTVKSSRGSGIDTLRLAIARKMAESAPLVGRKIDDDKAAAETMKAIASSIAGACPTYWILGNGTDPSTLAPELSAEHSACIQHDLKRREGVGASYGAGTFRALEGSLALWREAERALRLGVGNVSPVVKPVLEAKLARIEAATQKIDAKKLPGVHSQATVTTLGDVHADAGILLWSDGGAPDAAAPTLKTPF
jgi:hypothetical protein